MVEVSRRHLLAGSAAAAATAAAGVAIGRKTVSASATTSVIHGEQQIDFHGKHQAGIATVPAAFGTFIALDLKANTDVNALRRMMRILTDDARRLTAGEPSLADTEPELALVPARLTVTFGFGPRFVERAGGQKPRWLRPLPPFAIDRLESRWSDGDLLLQIQADDPLVVTHAARVLLKDARGFASLRWRQDGYRRAVGTEPEGTTMRNIFGQIDGTVSLDPQTPEFAKAVWCDDGWWADGTSLVLRRIEMDMEEWDIVGRSVRETSIGRRLDNGAPLTGTDEFDEPDLEAKNEFGLLTIPEFAHLRRSRTDDPTQVMHRRPYNYDDQPEGDQISNVGLLFAAYQADVDHQYIPIQQRLSDMDLLNEWTTPIGSAVFVLPPGCGPDGYIGETLLG